MQLLGVAAILVATAGWENVCPGRSEFPAAKVVWTAPAAGFDVKREGGAEGEVSLEAGAIRIKKTNEKGRIVVNAPSFHAEKGKSVRLFADVSAKTESPSAAVGYLCAYGEKRVLAFPDPISAKEFSSGCRPYMRGLVNSAPGMTYRKYAHFTPDDGPATPAIVIEGAPSESV